MKNHHLSLTKLVLICLFLFTIIGSGWAPTTIANSKYSTKNDKQKIDLSFSSEFLVNKMEKQDGYLVLMGTLNGNLLADTTWNAADVELNLKHEDESNKSFPLNNCILSGNARGDLSEERFKIVFDKLNCAPKQNITKIQGMLFDTKENIGLKGVTVELIPAKKSVVNNIQQLHDETDREKRDQLIDDISPVVGIQVRSEDKKHECIIKLKLKHLEQVGLI